MIINDFDLDYSENSQIKKIVESDLTKKLLFDIEEIGNDFDLPDEDLIKLMDSTNNDKNNKNSPEKLRKSSISNKYNVEPIQEESIIDYVKPKKNSYLLFLERNDVFGKVSYDKKERESLFMKINLNNENNTNESDDPKTFLHNFKKLGKSINSLTKEEREKGIYFKKIIIFDSKLQLT